jgi:hypothetical protein
MERAWSLVVDDDRRVFMDEGPALEISDDVDSANKHPCAAHSAAQESIVTGSITGESEDVLHLDGVASISALCWVCFTPRVVDPVSI